MKLRHDVKVWNDFLHDILDLHCIEWRWFHRLGKCGYTLFAHERATLQDLVFVMRERWMIQLAERK